MVDATLNETNDNKIDVFEQDNAIIGSKSLTRTGTTHSGVQKYSNASIGLATK